MNKFLFVIALFMHLISFCQHSKETQISATKIYHSNGKIKSEGIYTNGIKEGPWKTYYKNGKLKSEGKYVHGKKIGIHKNWY